MKSDEISRAICATRDIHRLVEQVRKTEGKLDSHVLTHYQGKSRTEIRQALKRLVG